MIAQSFRKLTFQSQIEHPNLSARLCARFYFQVVVAIDRFDGDSPTHNCSDVIQI